MLCYCNTWSDQSLSDTTVQKLINGMKTSFWRIFRKKNADMLARWCENVALLSLFGIPGQWKTRQACYYRLKRPLSVSICHVESDPITVTSGQVYYEPQLSGGILCSLGRLTEVFYRRSFTRVAPRGAFRPVLYHVSPPLKSLRNLHYFLPKVQVCGRRGAARPRRRRITGERRPCVRVPVLWWMYTCLPGVRCDPTLLSPACLKQIQMACGVQTRCRRKRAERVFIEAIMHI